MATYELEIQPFPVPETARLKMPPGRREDGMRPVPELRLVDLPRSTLEAMCAEFTSRVLTVYDQHHVVAAQMNEGRV